jgi:hypothetical protein
MFVNNALGVRCYLIKNWVQVVSAVGQCSWESIRASVQSDIDLSNILEYRHTEPGGVGVLVARGVDELVPQAAEVV